MDKCILEVDATLQNLKNTPGKTFFRSISDVLSGKVKTFAAGEHQSDEHYNIIFDVNQPGTSIGRQHNIKAGVYKYPEDPEAGESFAREQQNIREQERVMADNPMDFNQEPASDDDDDASDDGVGSARTSKKHCCGFANNNKGKHPVPTSHAGAHTKKQCDSTDSVVSRNLLDNMFGFMQTSATRQFDERDKQAELVAERYKAELVAERYKAELVAERYKAELVAERASMAVKIAEGVQAARNDMALIHRGEIAAKDIELKDELVARDAAHKAERIRNAQAAIEAKDKEMAAKNAEFKAAIAAKDKEMAAKTVEFKAAIVAKDTEMAAKNVELETTRAKLNEATAKNDLLAATEVLINAEKGKMERSKSEFAENVRILQAERESFVRHLETASADLKERTDAAALKEIDLDASKAALDIRKAALNIRDENITRQEREDGNPVSQRKTFMFAYIGTRFDPSKFNELNTAVQIAKVRGCADGVMGYCVVTLAIEKRFSMVERLLDVYCERFGPTAYASLQTKEKISQVCNTELAVRRALEAGTAWEWAAAAPLPPAV